jgi:uncharacterized membrane protein YeaQ/YmgE (transglycosylase-associated protein family)
MITFLILVVLGGLIVGALARLALPGPDPMGILATIGVGIAGSFLAGLVSAALLGRNAGSFILSVLFATGIVYLIRRSRGGTLTRPGGPPAERRW